MAAAPPPPPPPPSGPPQPFPAPYVPAPPAGVHRRTFFLAIAQIIIIVLAVGRIVLGVALIGFGVFIVVAGQSHLSSIPGFDQFLRRFGSGRSHLAAAVSIIVGAALLIAGIVDMVLGIIVGRPSNLARWFIIVLDSLSVLYVLGLLSRGQAGAGTTAVLVSILVLKLIVFYALVIDPATRRDFAATVAPGA